MSALSRVQAPGQNALLCVQAVFRLVEHDRLRPVDHLVGDLVAAVGGQAMHEHRIRLRPRHQGGIDLVALEQIVAALAVGVLTGEHAPGELVAAGADVVLEDLTEFAASLDAYVGEGEISVGLSQPDR